MAAEISIVSQVTATKGNITLTRSRTFTPDWTLARHTLGVQNIATTAGGVAVDLGPTVTTPAVSYFVNLDTANYVEVGVQVGGTFYPFVRLKAGEMYVFRLAVGPTALYARANTAAVDLEFGVLQE